MGKKAYIDFINKPQYSMQVYDYAIQVGQFDMSNNLIERLREINLLESFHVKYNKEKLVFAVKDCNGRLYWLEQGNESVGLKHIIKRHKDDFIKRYGVDEKNIAVFIKNLVLSENKIAERKRLKNGRLTIQQNYEYKGKYYTLNAVGTNGFIVTCYPIESEE